MRCYLYHLSLLLFVGECVPLFAQATWQAGTSDWNTAGNWTGGNVPDLNSESATFSTSGSTTVDLSANTTFQLMTFLVPTQNYTFQSSSGRTLTFDGNNAGNVTVAQVNGTQTFDLNIATNNSLGGNERFVIGTATGGVLNFSAGRTVTINSGGMVLQATGAGTGTFNIFGAVTSTGTGALTHQGGGTTVIFRDGSSFTGTTSANATIANSLGDMYFETTNISLFAGAQLTMSGSLGGDAAFYLSKDGLNMTHNVRVANTNVGPFTRTIGTDITGGGTATWSGQVDVSQNVAAITRTVQLFAAANNRAKFTGNIISTSTSTDAVTIGGTGIVEVSGTGNTYDIPTTVNANATLLVKNASGSATGVNNVTVNGILGGTGFITPTGTNTITINSGGSIAPGDGGIGTLTLNLGSTTGGVTFANGSTLSLDLNAPGTNDVLAFTGTTLNSSEVVLNNNAVAFNNLGSVADGTYTLFTFDANAAYTGTLGSITGLGVFSGSFVYNAASIQLTIAPFQNTGATDIVISQNITGTSNITQSGTGSTTLTGTNTSTGTTTVSSGLLVIGTSAGGNWAGNVVANGGTLKGRGAITGNLTVNNSALYSPGNSPGIQQVGSLTINPGGTLLIEIDGATAGNGNGFYDQIQSAGVATINGGTLQGFTNFSGSTNFIPQFGTKVTFLTASSVTGSFQSYDFSGNGNGVSWMPEYRNTEVNLFAVPADFGNVSGFNSNQNSVGRALQSFRPAAIDARTVAGSSGVTATSDVGKIFNGLMRQDNSGLKTAYDQLSPEKLTAMSATVKQFGSISNSGTNQRLSQIRWGDRGVSLNGITLQTLDGDYENELLAVEKGAILIPKKKFSGKTGFFVNTTGSYSDVDSDERRIGYENRLGGITAGIDQELTKEVTAGFFAGQGYADTKLGGGGGSVEANSGRIGIYGGYHKNGYYLNGSLGAGTTSFDTKRNIGFIGETASGSTQGYDLSGQIVGGVDFQTDEWVWGPLAKVDYGYQWIEKYNERGSAARLNLDSQAGASAETGAGMRVSRPFNYNGWKWIPELRLMGSHQWEKPNEISAQFAAGGDAFTVHPEGAGQEMIIPGAGLQLRFSETTTLNFGYEARVNLDSCSHQLDLGITRQF